MSAPSVNYGQTLLQEGFALSIRKGVRLRSGFFRANRADSFVLGFLFLFHIERLFMRVCFAMMVFSCPAFPKSFSLVLIQHVLFHNGHDCGSQ
jgi:hypothetical protein